ncbi:serine/threonine-protein kinase [Limnoglobus roseus]|uniref:non-specific serine/threonine protein kinase n=1 Tax=Limnoglobus roseus TaxID=2598579 RepID=A0A5C1A920_9BACT|nr:serine/threonine-protein kinase [Limnoglobus roseus]QEL15691.1 serine/threonine protein kinase [Limnoglobus roseus]
MADTTHESPHGSTDAAPHDGTQLFQPDVGPSTVMQTSEQLALAAALSAGHQTVPGYQILGEIGRGGMGVVYKAKQIQANRVVALKMILGGSHAGAADRERFRTEIEATAQLQHPGIVRVYEVGEHHGLPFFSMEFCEGGSLARKGGRPQSPNAAAAIVERIARAVEAAHLAGIVHRDLKPGNILMTGDGTPKVGDFGLAKRLDSVDGHTHTGAVMGTPNYMAPEQAAGKAKAVGPQADVYAIGVILFELLAGRQPFQAEGLPELLQKVVHNEAPSLSEFRRDAPRDLETICQKCLAKDPAHRYPTAGALADDLRRFQSGESISARQLNVVERFAWMLEKSHYDQQFVRYAGFFLWLAPVFFLPELYATFVRFHGWPVWWVMPAYAIRPVLGLSLFLYYGDGRIWPANPAEQHILSVWGSFVVVAGLLFVNLGLREGGSTWNGPDFYQAMAGASTVAFVSLGAMFWGGFYLVGLAFLLLIPVMPIDPRFCPIEYGSVWAMVSLLIGLRLRKLAKHQAGHV